MGKCGPRWNQINVYHWKGFDENYIIIARERFPVLELCPVHVCGTESIDLHAL